MLNPNYITAIELEEYFVNKFSGEPLSGGWLYFFEDLQRTTPKNVFTLTGGPPNYTYTSEGAALQLSGAGTVVDNAGNPIKIYYYPFDAFGNPQLYYVVCTDANGVQQFVRQAQPNPNGPISGVVNAMGNENMLSNPQFAQINTIPSGQVLNFVGAGTTVFQIAPDWNLNVTSTGSGTVTVTRNSIAGSAALPSNPPYTLTITPGANISGMNLTQTLPNNPDIFSPSVAGAQNGFVNASVLLANNSSVNINYVTSNTSGSAPISQLILTFNNNTGGYAESNATVQLVPAANPDNGSIGYVQFQVVLNNLVTPTELSNLQLIGLSSNITNVAYQQTTVNRQIDHLFNYYEPLLVYKNIPSYLVGWDFPFNPAQFLGYTVNSLNTGPNTSNYIWDQTIVFQSVTNSFAATTGNGGALTLTTSAATQLAIIQYIPNTADYSLGRLLYHYLSSHIEACTSAGNIPTTVSIWYTTNGSLPSIAGTGQSFVLTLDANGHPSSVVAGWHEVPLTSNLGTPSFLMQPPNSQSANLFYNQYQVTGWHLGGVIPNNVTFMAIVVGNGPTPNATSINYQTVSLQPGLIATPPGPKSYAENLIQCQQYYTKTFAPGVIPQQAIGLGHNESHFVSTNDIATSATSSLVDYFPVEMYSAPTLTTYNPVNANASVYDASTMADCTIIGHTTTQRGLTISFNLDAGAHNGAIYAFHWTADSRLGV